MERRRRADSHDIGKTRAIAGSAARDVLLLRYMLDSNPCIRVPRNCPAPLRNRFNRETGAMWISTIVSPDLPVENRREVDRFTARNSLLSL